MKFHQLPAELIAAVVDRCDYLTIIDLFKTSKKMNKIIKAYQLDKIEADQIAFNILAKLRISIYPSPKKRALILDVPAYIFQNFAEPPNYQLCKKISPILKSIKSIDLFSCSQIYIDSNFTKMLKEVSVDWKRTNTKFGCCSYAMPKDKVLSFWKTFKSVEEKESYFQEPRAEFINDEMMLCTLPNITINKFCCGHSLLERNARLTDRTLELLAGNRPKFLRIGNFTANYTLGGIIQLFRAIASIRDPSIDSWDLGFVKLNLENYRQLINDLKALNNKFVSFVPLRGERLSTWNVGIYYKVEKSEHIGRVCIGLIQPPGIVDDPLVMNEDHQDDHEFEEEDHIE